MQYCVCVCDRARKYWMIERRVSSTLVVSLLITFINKLNELNN